MAFHCGLLRYLAEHNRLEDVSKISSVSGGTLLTGLLLQINGMKWPTSAEYLESNALELKTAMTSVNLEREMICQLIKPWNWRYILSRANILALAICKAWGISATLDDVPASPTWSINGTTAETGKRCRFKGAELLDWVLGSTKVSRLPLQDAMAMSAAFPGLVGPYVFPCSQHEWSLPIFGNPQEHTLAHKKYKRIHLYDGGVYDNLGLEAFYDAGQGVKPGMEGSIVISDAGAPLPTGFSLGPFNLFRLKHVADIMSDQVRSLRVRGFVPFALAQKGRGAYLHIGLHVDEAARMFKTSLPDGEWLAPREVAEAAAFPTRLKRLEASDFDLLERHGYESAKMGDAIFQYL
jgi:NTE family protein